MPTRAREDSTRVVRAEGRARRDSGAREELGNVATPERQGLHGGAIGGSP